jgi:hypothetical protein
VCLLFTTKENYDHSTQSSMSNYGLSDEAKREIEKLDETQANILNYNN